jgi:hypothetical protein
MLRTQQIKENVMPRPSAQPDVDVDTTVDGEVAPQAEPAQATKKSEPKRPPLPAGLATPVGLAKAISARTGTTLAPQMVYSTLKNAPKEGENAFPYVDEANYGPNAFGGRTQVFDLEQGIAWWESRKQRVADRKASAEAKKAEKAARAQQTGAQSTPDSGAGDAVEAE